MKRTGLILGAAIILVSNGIALIGVARNRAGDPVQTIELTERELPLLNSDPENTGVDLRVNWIQAALSPRSWSFDQTQLEAAGFSFPMPPSARTQGFAFLPREAYVALEHEGQRWEEWLQLAEQAKQQGSTAAVRTAGPSPSGGGPNSWPGLFLVDASRDMSDLRSRYPDQGKYLIVRAVLMARTEAVKDSKTGEVTSYKYSGRVVQIMPDVIHVPLPYSRLISSLKPRTEGEPRYTVTLKYGTSLEPWVSAVRLFRK
jgi:hypothetical protein